MDNSLKIVLGIGVLMFIFVLISAIQLMIIPVMEGTGSTIALATGTNGSGLVVATNATAYDTATTQGTVFSFLPYIGVVFGLIILIFGRNFIADMIGGGGESL